MDPVVFGAVAVVVGAAVFGSAPVGF
ncbi:MAG: hypothetical protein V7604_1329, partial [Hyphomicrobiales bacterium]